MFQEARKRFGGPRAEPTFLVIGAQKSGTSSMFFYLIQHPQILRPIFKEIYYFDRHYDRGPRWYGANFPALSTLRGLQDKTGLPHHTFESTATYIFDERAPERIARDLKTRKFIALLRDPVDRAISAHQHAMRLGIEPLPLYDAIMRDLDWYHADLAYQNGSGPQPKGPEPRSFVRRGIYSIPVQRWRDRCPNGSFMISQSEQFFAEPAKIMARVFEFLGVSAREDISYEAKNVGGYRDTFDDVRAVLKEFYRPHNEELRRLCGTDFTW